MGKISTKVKKQYQNLKHRLGGNHRKSKKRKDLFRIFRRNRKDRKNDHLNCNSKKRILSGLNIKTKLFLGFAVPVILIILLGTISYSKSAKGLISSYEKSATQAIQAVSSHLEFAFEIVEASASELVIDQSISYYAAGMYERDLEQLRTKTKDIRNGIVAKQISNNFIQDVYIIPKKNVKVLTTKSVNLDGFYEEYAKTEEGTKIQENPYGVWQGSHQVLDGIVSKVLVGGSKQTTDKYGITYAKSFLTKLGCVIIDVEKDEIVEVLNDLEFGKGSMVGFLTGDGKEIYSDSTQSLEAGFFSEQAFVQKSLSEGEEAGYDYVDYKGKEYMYMFHRVGDTGFTICVLVPKAEIIKQANETKNITIVLIILSCIAAVLIGWMLTSMIGKSIRELMVKLKSVAAGDFTTDIRVSSKDELSILAGSIKDTLGHVRGLIEQVAQLSSVVMSSAQDVTTTTDTMSDMANNINSSIEQIGEAIESEAKEAQCCVNDMEVLSSKITNVNDKVVAIETFAHGTKQMIETDITKMADLNDQSNRTNEIMFHLAKSIAELEGKTKAVTNFVEIINGIASQTNLLSLNASIEAARAGDAGRGFAVVAQEIRKLSEESANAANEIQKVATEIMKQTKSTVSSVTDAQEIVKTQNVTVDTIIDAFHGLNNEVERLLTDVEEIAQEMGNIAQSRATTLDSISNISASTEETYSVSVTVDTIVKEQTKSVEELRTVSTQLQEKAHQLEDAIGVFKI